MRLIKLASSAALIALLPLANQSSLAASDTPTSGVTMSLFDAVFNQVKSSYVEPVTDKQLVEGAIKGMLAALDPHSSYMDAKEYKEMMVRPGASSAGSACR